MAHRRGLLREDLDELEQHFRDHIDHLMLRGREEEQAFREARRDMGSQADAETAYRRVYWGKLKRKHARMNHLSAQLAMFRNYVRIALRNLRKQAGYSLLNIGGLSVGLACAFLIVLYVQHERSYDRFHENRDSLYRVIRQVEGPNGLDRSSIFPAGRALDLEGRYPEIESIILFDDRTPYLRIDNESRRIGTIGFMSPVGLDAFTFPLVRGNKETAFENPYSILLTEESAERLFGRGDPIGRRISYNDDFDVTVTGVLADVPSNSHLQFEALAPIELMRAIMGEDAMENMSNSNYFMYFKLVPGASPEALSDKIREYITETVSDPDLASRMSLYLQPITDIHFGTDIQWDVSTNVDPRFVYMLSGIAILIVLIAGINFMNLATARAVKRAKEVGVRKSVGAQRGQLVAQFMGESLLLSAGAIVLGLILTMLFLPVFRGIVDSDIAFSVTDWRLLALLVGIGFGAGFLAGVYPAFYLSDFRPARVLKGEVTRGSGAARLRKGLIVLQFGISVFLIVSTLVVYNQINFMRSKKLGFDKEQVVFAPMTAPVREGYDAFRQNVLQNPRILSVAQAGNMPGRVNTSRGYHWPVGAATADGTGGGTTAAADGAAEVEQNGRSFYTVLADYDYIETLGLNLIAGRNFSRDMPTDFENAYILNEAAAQSIGYTNPEDAVGGPFRAWDREMGEIVGIVEDFHFQSLHQEIGPVVLNIKPWISYVAFRVAPGQYREAIDFLDEQWRAVSPGFPFDYRFLDADFDRLYRSEVELGRLFTFFAIIAIFVACLGLFGLSAYSVEQRTKEIGIRKVLGASTQSITLLLSREFTVLVLVAFLVSAPAAWFVMQRWLSDFAYRVPVAWWIFVLSGGGALLIAWLTVAYQSLRAAYSNPVRSLRYE